jgi:hypothetical protein
MKSKITIIIISKTDSNRLLHYCGRRHFWRNIYRVRSETGKDIEVDPMKNLELVLNEAKGTKTVTKPFFLRLQKPVADQIRTMRSKMIMVLRS